jgi:xanthine dehydrogenase small subunit
MDRQPEFRLNGRPIALAAVDPTLSLLRWLKGQHLTGTKEGCGDGDCGACTVTLIERDAHGVARPRAVNSCLLPMGTVVGREVLTVEALAQGDALHPVQQALVEAGGSQCGYCTPGFVMSLFAGYYTGELSDHTTEGNLCRCTGYRPIRAATATLRDADKPEDRFHALFATARATPEAARLGEFHSPTTVDDALRLKAAHPDATWIAGGTDLGVALSHGRAVAPGFIALDRIAELQTLRIDDTRVRLGAGVSLSTVEHALRGVCPALDDMLPWFAARQVRNRATVGGNLGTASPIGDLLPVLLALDATIELAGPRGRRSVPVEAYFLDYRKTARADDELIVAVEWARDPALISASYKVAKRQTDDISIVAAAFAIRRDDNGRVNHARLAFGGVAATPRRARAAEQVLIGTKLDADTTARVMAAIEAEFAPISDHRASAAYRRQLCGNLFAKWLAERGP